MEFSVALSVGLLWAWPSGAVKATETGGPSNPTLGASSSAREEIGRWRVHAVRECLRVRCSWTGGDTNHPSAGDQSAALSGRHAA